MSCNLILDVSNLAHRAFHAMGGGLMSYEGEPTEVLYGLFRDVVELKRLFKPRRVAWCFDGGFSGRRDIFDGYKANRLASLKEMDRDERAARDGLRKQIWKLRTKHLPAAGFKNILWQDGYEADDLIASACYNLPANESAVVVSNDMDLLQLLSERVTIWKPITKLGVTVDSFSDTWGISPKRWVDAKSIAGDASDGIPGVGGVGLKTAIKYLTGHLKETTKTYQAIINNTDLWKRNAHLIGLPFPGTQEVRLVDERVTKESWNKVMSDLGIKSLARRGRSRGRVR